MDEPRSREGDGQTRLRVDRVDLVPTDLGVVLVRVSGSWEGEPPPYGVVLAAGDRRFERLPQTSAVSARAAGAPNAFRAAFSVPEEVRPALAAGLRLEVGGEEIALPGPRDAQTGEAPAARATVVDRAVLAERRARRAELAEEAIARRAEESERALAALEGELAKLELRLEQANDERSELSARLADAVRDARAAAQRAEAERRRREEALADVAEVTDEAEQDAERLRERAASAGERARELDREVEALRRRVAEAEHAATAATAARARAESLAGHAEEAARQLIERERDGSAMRRAATTRAEAELAARTVAAEVPPPPVVVRPDPDGTAQLIEAERRLARGRREPGDLGVLRDEARHAAAAVADATWTLAEARDALGGAGSAVEAERALRAGAEAERDATAQAARRDRERAEAAERELRAERERRAGLERDAAAEREAAARLAAEVERHAGLEARAREAIEELRARVEELQGLAVRARRADEARAALREYASTAGEALEEAEKRIGQARDAASLVQDRLEEERLERERAERALREELAEHVEAATARVRDELEARILTLAGELATEREARQAAEAALAERPVPKAGVQPAPKPRPPVRPRPDVAPWLPTGLRRLAAADPQRAIRLGVQLLPAQALAVEEPLDYDLLAGELGWHAVALRPGRGTVATLHKPRPRRGTDFRLSVDARALAELLAAGGSREVRRAGSARVRGTLRRRRALRLLPAAPLDLADLARAGIWPDPGFVLSALGLLIDPAWTEGEPLRVALKVVGARGGQWSVDSPGGEPITVTRGRAESPSATVRMPQAAFQSLLAGRPGATEGKAAIRGDVGALGRLVEWIERAQHESG